MDAAQALADLTEISSQVTEVAILDRDGSLLASTATDLGHAQRFVAGVRRLLDEVDRISTVRGLPELAQLEVSTHEGSVFVVRRDGRMIAASTRSDPTVGLVLYDLKHCIGSLDEAPAAEANGKQPARGGAGTTRARAPRKKADTSAKKADTSSA
jgi:predicted regulator of Ras-like GTPase activity (Roadblock/LC7/MglB family)